MSSTSLPVIFVVSSIMRCALELQSATFVAGDTAAIFTNPYFIFKIFIIGLKLFNEVACIVAKSPFIMYKVLPLQKYVFILTSSPVLDENILLMHKTVTAAAVTVLCVLFIFNRCPLVLQGC